MKTTFDTDGIIFSLLKTSEVKAEISGGIYVGDGRPADSVKEDVVINSIALSQNYLPQVGASNINVFVPDMTVTIGGKTQLQANRTRLKQITDKVITAVRQADIEGLKVILNSQVILPEPEIKQHFVNIRIDWNIQTH